MIKNVSPIHFIDSDNENLRAFPEREKAGLKRFIDEGLQDGDVQPLTNVRHK